VHGSPNLVYINVSPIEYGHVLLVPRVMDCLPQVCGASGGKQVFTAFAAPAIWRCSDWRPVLSV
jgi:hypothetical protein